MKGIIHYSINYEKLEIVSSVMDLSVLIDVNLSYKQHINLILASANKSLGFVIRNTRHFKNIDVIIKWYNALVRSKLEYAAIVWSPYRQVLIDNVEHLQNQFLCYLYFKLFCEVYPFGFSTEILRDLFHIPALHFKQCIYLGIRL